MYDKGHIIVKRDIKNWGWYSNSKVFTVFVHLLIEANWKEGYWEGNTIKRGELVTSIGEIANLCGLSIQEVRTCMKILGGAGEVLSRRVGRRSILTICNYDDYQDDQQDSNTVATSQQQVSNKSTTSQQPSIIEQWNKGTTEQGNKEKKTSNDVKEKAKRFVPPTVDEVRAFCEENGYAVDAYQFVNYYASKGWVVGKSPMKDWEAAVRTWVRKREELAPQNQTPPKPTRTFTSGFKIASGGGLLDGIEY